MLGGPSASARFSTVYGNNVLVGEKKVVKEKERESPGIGIVARMSSVLGKIPMVQMSPLPPVPKIPAALGGGGMLMGDGKVNGGNGFLAVNALGSARESLVSLHSTVNGPLPEYFDSAAAEDKAAVAVLKIDNTNLVSQGGLSQEVGPTAEDQVDAWEARRAQGTEMRRTHSVRSRSASRPGKIRARMPRSVSRGSSRSSTLSNKPNTPRSIHRTMSGASRKSDMSTYSRETGQETPQTGTLRTGPYIGGTTPKSASAPFNAPPMPLLPAPIAPPPQTPLPALPVVESTRKKSRKAKPARIMLPQEILAMEARRESRRGEMRMLAEKQETVMRPIQEAETSCSSEGGNDDDGFRTETDSENELHQVKSKKMVMPPRRNASSTIPRVAVAGPPAPAAPLLSRKATPRPTRKPVPPTTRGHVYSIFPASPRRGSRGQLVFPPPTLPGTIRRQDSGLKSPGMAPSPVPASPPRAPAAKPEVSGDLMKAIRRRNTSRKSTIVSPTPKIGNINGGIGSAFAGIPSFDFNFLPLGIALTPLRVPVVVTPGGEIVAEISGDRSSLIIEGCEEKQGRGEVAAMRMAEKESVRAVEMEGEKENSILNRPRPKKPQSRPVTRGTPTAGRGNRGSQVSGFGAGVGHTFYNELEEQEASSEEASPELQRRRSKYDSEIYTLLPPTSSPAHSTSSTPSAVEVELADESTHLDVASIARSSLPGSLRDSFYEELRVKYSKVASRLSSDPDSEEEEFIGGVLHMGTPPLDSGGESDEGSSFGDSPPLPPPGSPLSPLKPLKIQKVPTMPMEIEEMGVGVVKREEVAETLRRTLAVEVTGLDSRLAAEVEAPQVAAVVVMETPVPAVVPVQRQQTLRKPVPAPGASKALPPIPPQAQPKNPTPPSVPRSTSRATINPALDNSSSSSSYGPDPNEAFAALQMRTGDPFYSPTSKKTPQPPFAVLTYAPTPPRPAPQAPSQSHQHWQPNMLPGMPKRRVELPRFTRTVRHTPTPAPSVPVRETPFFLDVRTPGSKTVYSASPPLKQEETPPPTRSYSPATVKQSTQTPAPPVPTLPENYRQTAGPRPRATTHSGALPPIPMHAYPPPPVPPIPRNTPTPILTTSGPLQPPPPRNYDSVMYLNRNSDPISAMNGNEHVLSHYTPGTLITVPNASSPQILHRVDAPKAGGGHWRSTSSGEDTGHGSNATAGGTARHTMKVRLEKAFKLGMDRHGVVELGQGEFGGNWVEGQEDSVEPKKELRKHASKASLGGWGTRLKSGVFGGSGQGH